MAVNERTPVGAESAALDRTVPRISEYGFFFDFDGTLSAIGDDPQAVTPVAGAPEALAALAALAGRVAIVSARPVAFLGGRLPGIAGLDLYGLYGLEYSADGGRTVATAPEAEPYIPVIEQVVAEARAAFPGALVEDKRLSCALHYRTAPQLAADIDAWCANQASARGLKSQHGRMVVELKPPVDTDKGAVVLAAVRSLAGAWYFGDDLGDLAAFDALSRVVGADPRFHAVRVAVANPDGTGAPLAERADLRLESPDEVAALIRALAARGVRG